MMDSGAKALNLRFFSVEKFIHLSRSRLVKLPTAKCEVAIYLSVSIFRFFFSTMSIAQISWE